MQPDFKRFINPVQIRRMSRALKIGFSAAISCIDRSGVGEIDAIIIGTGKGCLVDTEEFLHSIKKYNETALNPTHFIHSTYNQLNGMIALDRKINSYNVTYAHRGFSFEHTLLDASLLMQEGEANHVLVGSFDEMTEEHFLVKKIWGYWKEEMINSMNLLQSDTPGTIAGEGSSFYVLGDKKTKENQVSVKGIRTLYRANAQEILEGIESMLAEANVEATEIDIIMHGNNGSVLQQQHDTLLGNKMKNATMLYFKHLCGEYDTAVQFGFWLSTQILEQQVIPDVLYLDGIPSRKNNDVMRHILVYNNYFEVNQSLILLSIV